MAVGLGAGLSACSNSGLNLAGAACAHIDQSIGLLDRANHTTDPVRVADERKRAYLDLIAALPISAQAAYVNPQWQALMTTLSESNTVPEPTLVPALEADCSVVKNSVFGQPAPPSSSIPPPSP